MLRECTDLCRYGDGLRECTELCEMRESEFCRVRRYKENAVKSVGQGNLLVVQPGAG